jgi:hypothetical protein
MKQATQIRYFRLLKGRHYDQNETLYIAEDEKRNIVKSNEDLCAKFKNKFEEITERMAVLKQHVDNDQAEAAAAEYGDDVTKKFPVAVKNGLKVFRNAEKLHVIIDPATPNQPLNRKPLKKESVAGFIELQIA